MHPPGTKHEPIVLKCRYMSHKNHSMIVGIPKDIVNLLGFENGQEFLIYVDFDVSPQRIVLEMMPKNGS